MHPPELQTSAVCTVLGCFCQEIIAQARIVYLRTTLGINCSHLRAVASFAVEFPEPSARSSLFVISLSSEAEERIAY